MLERVVALSVFRYHAPDLIFSLMDQQASEGDLLFVTDDPIMPTTAYHMIFWISIDEQQRVFVDLNFGREVVRFGICGIVWSRRKQENVPNVDLLQSGLEAGIRELMKYDPQIQPLKEYDRHRRLYYGESGSLLRLGFEEEGVATVMAGAINQLKLNEKGYTWRHPSVIGNVVIVPAGFRDLALDDLVLSIPHPSSAPNSLRLPDALAHLIELKAVQQVWLPHALERGSKYPVMLPAPGDPKEVFAQNIAQTRTWVESLLELNREIRDVRAMRSVRSLPSVVTPVFQKTTTIPGLWFFKDSKEQLEGTIRSAEDELQHGETMAAIHGQQLRQEFDLWLGERNVRLQERIEKLTWVIVFLTVMLAVMTIALTLDSPTFQRWLEWLLPRFN